MRRVLLATPSKDHTVRVEYMASVVHTMDLGRALGILVDWRCIPGDALVQRARNDLVKIALDGKYDDLFFVDADQQWDPAWFFRLLNHQVDLVAAPVRKKSEEVQFNVGLDGAPRPLYNGLLGVQQVGTGFMRIACPPLRHFWEASRPYKNQGTVNREVFCVSIADDGELLSEDVTFCRRWPGGVWVDPSFTVPHWGDKSYTYDFLEVVRSLYPEWKP